MLKQRIITAVVLLAILLPALFWPSPVPFAAVMLVLIGAGAWEWGRLNGFGQARVAVARRRDGCCCARCPGGWACWSGRCSVLWIVAGAAWVLGGAALLRAGGAGLAAASRGLCAWSAACWRCGWPGWRSVQARMIGINFLLSILVLVWVADIFAYFAGRAFGLKFTRSKLAPTHQSRQELGRRLGRHGRRASCSPCLGLWPTRPLQAGVPSLYTRLAERGLVAAADRRRLPGGHERGRRPGRIAGQAQRRRQGQQRPAARPWRRARPGRRAAAHAAAGHDAGLSL